MKIIIEADLLKHNQIKEPKLIEAYIRYNLRILKIKNIILKIKNIEIIKEEK